MATMVDYIHWCPVIIFKIFVTVMTSWHGNAFRITDHLWVESTSHTQTGQLLRHFDVSLLLTRTNCWISDPVSADLICHGAHVTSLLYVSNLDTARWHQYLQKLGAVSYAYKLVKLRALKFSTLYKILSFNVWVRYFVWNFKGICWNSTQNILPTHRLMCSFSSSEYLFPRFTSS